MKRYRGWLAAALCAALCAGAAFLVLQATAEYPALGDAVSYPVNQIDGFDLTIEEPAWTPFRGYTIRWAVAAESDEVYSFCADGPGFEYLERRIDGRWYRLGDPQDESPFNPLEFPMGGGESSKLEGSIVQKYARCGTRLESGTYRVVLEMRARDQSLHYLAAEFTAA